MQNEMFQPERTPPPEPPLSTREQALAWARRAWRPTGTVVAVLLAALVMGHVVNGNHGLSVWHQKRAEDQQLQREIKDLQGENARLKDHVEHLKTDPEAIEHEARVKLHYAKAGEVIVALPETSQAQTPAPTK